MINIRRYGISILYCFLILIACTLNLSSMPSAPVSNFDKFVHFFMFFLLGTCVYFENSNYFKTPVSFLRIINGTLLFPIVYGGLIELIQDHISPFRTGDWADFVWNSFGAVFGVLIALLINRTRNR
jgi:VanZ like family.